MEISAQTAQSHQEIQRMQRMNRNVAHSYKRMLGQRQCPAAAASIDDTTGPDSNIAPIDTTTKLVEQPKTLSILWKEYVWYWKKQTSNFVHTTGTQ